MRPNNAGKENQMMSGISFSELLIVFAVVALVFGSKKLPDMGKDIGTSIKNFRQAMSDIGGAETALHANTTAMPSVQPTPQLTDGFQVNKESQTLPDSSTTQVKMTSEPDDNHPQLSDRPSISGQGQAGYKEV